MLLRLELALNRTLSLDKFLNKLFRNRKNKNQTADDIKSAARAAPTIPLSEIALPGNNQRALDERLPQFFVGCAQSIGRQRDHNEDSLFTFSSNFSNNGSQLPFGLFIVADGMGGHKHGEIASDLAVKTVAAYILNNILNPMLHSGTSFSEKTIQEILQNGTLEAHQAILKHAPGGGTTLTAILMIDRQMTIAHVGDSRAYSVSLDGKLNCLTRDHSLVMRMIELGQLTKEEAAAHPQRNVLYRALGQVELFSVDIYTHPLPSAGFILICSDGLWGVLSDEQISKIIMSTPGIKQTSQALIHAANQAGGPDNITAVLIRIPE